MAHTIDATPAMNEFPADPGPAFLAADTLGDGLRQARALSGKSMAELVAETKVHMRFLNALE